MLCKRREKFHFAGGLRQAKHRTNQRNGPIVNLTLASRHLISIRIPLVIKKAATPRSQDFDLSVVRDRCHATFYEKALFVKPTWGSLVATESETRTGALRGYGPICIF